MLTIDNNASLVAHNLNRTIAAVGKGDKLSAHMFAVELVARAQALLDQVNDMPSDNGKNTP